MLFISTVSVFPVDIETPRSRVNLCLVSADIYQKKFGFQNQLNLFQHKVEMEDKPLKAHTKHVDPFD